MAQGARRQPGRRVLSRPRGDPGHEGAPLGPHRQRLLDGREDRRPHGGNRLRDLQGRAGIAHVLARAGARVLRRDREWHRPRLREDADGHRAAECRPTPAATFPDSGRPLLRAGGIRACRSLPRLAARRVHYRGDRRHQRRRGDGLKGKLALVPGGYGGSGAAICRGLPKAGAKVIVAGRDLRKASSLARKIKGEALQLDVRDTPSIETALKPFRRIDLFVNCAGVSREETLDEVSEAAWDEVLDTNLKAAMFLAQAVARRQKRGGKQVQLLSVRAQLGLRGRGYSTYCASKGGLVMLVKLHASELGPRGICVNGVAPTVVRTEMGAHWLKNPKTRAWLKERIPLGRVAETEDVVGAVLFFCSPATDYVTGQILYVDGGLTASQ